LSIIRLSSVLASQQRRLLQQRFHSRHCEAASAQFRQNLETIDCFER
jgi:hypothetical protein